MDLLNQMKNMPGMGDMSKIFSQMGIPGLGKNTKVNMGAMEAQMKKSMKTAQMRERMKAKASQAQNAQPNVEPEKPAALSEEELIKIFSTGEKVERTPRGAKPVVPDTNAKKKKTKK
jgi:hypothetical protein